MITNTIFYIFAFLAIYIQVFFLTTFLENRKKFSTGSSSNLADNLYPKVSLIVPCYNEEIGVVKTLDSLLALDYPKELLQIVVVDDGSKDNTWNEMQKYKNHSSVLLLQKKNEGHKTSALNFALKHVSGDIIASVDADTYLPPNSLKRMIHYFINDKETMAVGSSVIINNPKTIVEHAQSAEYNLFFFSKKMLATVGGAMVVPGAFSAYRKEVFEKLGGYKTAHNWEDGELTYRIQAAGWKVDQAHDVFSYTNAPRTVKALFKQRLRWAYGFLNNTFDYRRVILNKKYGNFGTFTVPTALLAYVVILYVFFVGWFKVISGLVDKVIEIRAVGFSQAWSMMHSFDFFKLDTRAISIFPFVLILSVVCCMMIGRFFVREKRNRSSLVSVVYFLILYNLVVPFWIITSVWKTVTAQKVSWR